MKRTALKQRSLLAPVLLLGLALLVSACSGEAVEAPPVVRPVKMVEFGATSADQTREYPGSITPAEEADLSFEVSGQIIAFPVREGQAVGQGTVLARINPSDYQARREAADAHRLSTQATYERYQQLYEQNVVSLQDLEVKRRDFDIAEANLQTAQKALEDTELRAPFSGTVAKTYVDNFRNVQAKEPVLKLQNESRLEVKVSVPEGDALLGASARGSRAHMDRLNPRVVVATLPGRAFPARLKEFSTAADPVSRTFEATLSFDQPRDARLLPGMTVRVIVDVLDETDAATRATIPANAVFSDDDGAPHVWVVDPSSMAVQRTRVEVGDLAGADIEIRSGLSSGALIAVTGVHNLLEGMRVSRLEN